MFEHNEICKLLNIKYPIFQGGMAWIGTAELAAAVSNAGGLGIIGAGHMPPDILRAEIHKAKAWTDKPFGVNIMLMSPFVKEVMILSVLLYFFTRGLPLIITKCICDILRFIDRISSL